MLCGVFLLFIIYTKVSSFCTKTKVCLYREGSDACVKVDLLVAELMVCVVLRLELL